MTEVEILGLVVTHQYGTLNTGDVLRTNSEFARHLVDDCGAAKYRAQPDVAAAAAPVIEALPEAVDPPPVDPAPVPPAPVAAEGDAPVLAKPGRKAKAQ